MSLREKYVCYEKECDQLKFTGWLKCKHGKYFSKYGEKALEIEAAAALKLLGL